MAKEMGAFEKHGVKADLVYISSGSITVQALMGGNLDMTVAASNAVVSSILRGAPLVAVGSITNRPAMSLFVQPEITRPEQLQGKVLGITRHGSSTHFLTQFVIEKLGLQDKVKIQPMGGTREVDTAIRTGMIAGAVRSMKPGPKVRMLVDLPDMGIPFSMDLIAVKRDFYKSSPRTVEAMLKAYIEGVAGLRNREDFAYKVLGKYLLGAGDSLDEAYDYAVKYLDRNARTEPAVIQTVLNWEGKKDIPLNEFFDNSIIEFDTSKMGFVVQALQVGRRKIWAMKRSEWRRALGELVRARDASHRNWIIILGSRSPNPGTNLITQLGLFIRHRRDCWAHVSANCPEMSVKQKILQHEYGEVIKDEYTEHGHPDLIVRQGKALGLSPEEVLEVEPLPTTTPLCMLGHG